MSLAGCHHLRILDETDGWRCRTCRAASDAWGIADGYAELADVERELLRNVGHYLVELDELAVNATEPLWIDVRAQVRVALRLLFAMTPDD